MDTAHTNAIKLQDLLTWGDIVFYGYREATPPDFVLTNTRARVRFYSRQGRPTPSAPQMRAQCGAYGSFADIRDDDASVFFLDHEAEKVFFAGFPSYARYVLMPARPRLSWLLMLPGLARRLLIGQLKLRGTIVLPVGGVQERWLVIEHAWARSMEFHSFLSHEVGVQGLLDYLRSENVPYVVLRFYEALPELHRHGADLDLLIADEAQEKVDNFLRQHPGPIRVELKAVSRPRGNGLPYYPPRLARRILASAISGPAGSRIPAPREAFLSLAYHALYHKGMHAGIPSRLSGIEVDQFPESDYAGVLQKMTDSLGLHVGITMEDLDGYLAAEGWRPSLDTLAKISLDNEWVRVRFFRDRAAEMGLSVLVLRERAFDRGVVDDILRTVAEWDGFAILRRKKFTKVERRYAADHLRGGVWADRAGRTEGLLPAMALVVLDLRHARTSLVNERMQARIRELKEHLRTRFDTDGESLVHSTDSTAEAWEYIHVCFPEEETYIKDKVRAQRESTKVSVLESFTAHTRAVVRGVTACGRKLRALAVRYTM